MKQYFLAIKEVLEVFFIALFSILFVYKFLAQPFLVQGASMEPTFESGDYLLVDEISYQVKEPSRGDLIVFRYPGNPNLFYIKRIIGLPGDTVEFVDSRIFVNSEPLEENYLPAGVETRSFGDSEFVLGEKQYFVMGDNRPYSSDSRRWGPIEKKDIVGEVRLRFWPKPEIFQS
jgi:signal peptidase I